MDITNLIYKTNNNSNKSTFTLTKRYPWSNRTTKIKFDLILLSAKIFTDDDGSEVLIDSIIKNVSVDGEFDWAEFEFVFETYDIQEDVKELLLEKYKLNYFGVSDIDGIQLEYKYEQ
jgi:hypothetical protein